MKERGLVPDKGGFNPVVGVLPVERPGTEVRRAFAIESSLALRLSKELPNCWISPRMLSMASCVSAALALRESMSEAKLGMCGSFSAGGSSSSSSARGSGCSGCWVDALRVDALRFGAEAFFVGFEAARAVGFAAREVLRRGAMWRPDEMTEDRMSVFWLMDGRK